MEGGTADDSAGTLPPLSGDRRLSADMGMMRSKAGLYIVKCVTESSFLLELDYLTLSSVRILRSLSGSSAPMVSSYNISMYLFPSGA